MKSDPANGGMSSDCLHVVPSDDAFKGRMRFHQSWYREHVLKLPPGPNPAAHGRPDGNMLRDSDGLDGRNFLDPAIHQFAKDRLQDDAGHIEAKRLRNNLLSSQPMCFNLFAPLDSDHEWATKLFRSLPGMPADLVVKEIRLEYAPDPAKHLEDGSSFDAFVCYERPGNVRGFIGIETKLTEPFSKEKYGFDSRYSRWKSQPAWYWKDGEEKHFPETQINQLWRNHLLAFSMLHQPNAKYQEAYCAVVYHGLDKSCVKSIKAYRELLADGAQATLLNWPLADVIKSWTLLAESRSQKEWLKAFHLRYLDLDASKPAWDAYLLKHGAQRRRKK